MSSVYLYCLLSFAIGCLIGLFININSNYIKVLDKNNKELSVGDLVIFYDSLNKNPEAGEIIMIGYLDNSSQLWVEIEGKDWSYVRKSDEVVKINSLNDFILKK